MGGRGGGGGLWRERGVGTGGRGGRGGQAGGRVGGGRAGGPLVGGGEGEQGGVVAGTEEAKGLAGRHRTLLSGFFPVTHAKHVLIARGYVEDPRFSAHYDQRAAGLAAWLKSIIDANAAAHGVDPDAATWE